MNCIDFIWLFGRLFTVEKLSQNIAIISIFIFYIDIFDSYAISITPQGSRYYYMHVCEKWYCCRVVNFLNRENIRTIWGIKFCFNLKKVRVRCIIWFEKGLGNIHYTTYKFLSDMPGLKLVELTLKIRVNKETNINHARNYRKNLALNLWISLSDNSRYYC